MEGQKIQTFRDLKAWQEAHKLVLEVYRITKAYPADEKFGLVSQSQRAAVSISSNIAEGFGRFSGKDKHHFYSMAKTSLAELQNQFLIARDLKYVDENKFKEMYSQSDTVGALIKGLMRTASDR
ncbi:MAG: four helix bundle protein [bacterium]|nr:four helix bundle protein [bacterium]